MNREEIAKKIWKLDGVCIDMCYCESIADWHISEIAAAEKRGYEKCIAIIKTGYTDFKCPEEKRLIGKCPEGFSCLDCYLKIIAANSDHIADAGEMIGGE